MTSATSPIILKWDPKSLEIRTLTVEGLLEPLVTQMHTYRDLMAVVPLCHSLHCPGHARTSQPHRRLRDHLRPGRHSPKEVYGAVMPRHDQDTELYM